MASCGGKSVIKALRRFYAYCLVIPLLVGIFMFYVFPGTIFFVFCFLLRARTRFSGLLCSVIYVLILRVLRHFLERRANMCASEFALVVVFVAVCEVQCNAVRPTSDHSECGPLSLSNFRFMRMRSLTILFFVLADVQS